MTDRFSSLYKKYGPAIYARCCRILIDPNDAEDATQEVFLLVAKHLDKAPSSAEVLLWIYRIATNYCLNELRNGKRRPATSREEMRDSASDRNEDLFADRDLARRIIERVPDHLGVSAWLHHVDGLSHEEVGKTLGLSRRTIFNYLAEFHMRARRILVSDS